MPETETVSVSEETSQVVDGNTFEDYFLALKITRPDSTWQFLDQEHAANLVPDASMGMINVQRQGYAALLGERLSDISLEQYIDLITSSGPLSTAKDLKTESIEIDGFPAIETQRQATIEGIDFTYHIVIVKRGDFFYQLIGWSLTNAFHLCESDLRSIANSISFVRDREPQVRSRIFVENDQSFDWKISEGIYSNAAFRFRLTPTENLSMMGQLELTIINEDATAGVANVNDDFHQIYLVEPKGDMDEDKFLEIIYTGISEQMEGKPIPEPTTVNCGGVTAKQFLFQRVETEGAFFDFTFTLFFHDGFFYRIQSWWPSDTTGLSTDLQKESLTMFEWISDQEVEQLETELASVDSNNAVGLEFCMRNGLFQDFEYGYSLRLPDGIWQVSTGDSSTFRSEDSRAIFNEARDGVQITLVPEQLDITHAKYHNILSQNLGIPDSNAARTVKHPDGDILVSAHNELTNGTPISYRLVTAQRGQRCVQLLMTCLQSLEANLDRRLPEIIEGFSFPEHSIQKVQGGGQVLIDNRLGYKLAVPNAWAQKPTASKEFESVGSLVVYANNEAGFGVVAICLDSEIDEEILIDAMAKNSGITFDPRTRKESTSTLGSVPAKLVQMSGRINRESVFIKIWIGNRGNTQYVFFVHGESGSKHETNAEDYKRFMKLIY